LPRIHDHTQTHHNRQNSSVGGISPTQIPLPDNTHNRHTSMPPAVFEPTIVLGERPQTHALDRAANGIGPSTVNFLNFPLSSYPLLYYYCLYILLLLHLVLLYVQRLRWSRGSVLAFGTQVRGFTPGRSLRIFRAKKFSARLPSEGK